MKNAAKPPVDIRPVAAANFEAWLPLWKGYQAFYNVDIADAVTRTTWERFLDPAEPMHAALARSEEHTSELQSLMRTSYAVFCLKKKTMTTGRKYLNAASNGRKAKWTLMNYRYSCCQRIPEST